MLLRRSYLLLAPASLPFSLRLRPSAFFNRAWIPVAVPLASLGASRTKTAAAAVAGPPRRSSRRHSVKAAPNKGATASFDRGVATSAIVRKLSKKLVEEVSAATSATDSGLYQDPSNLPQQSVVNIKCFIPRKRKEKAQEVFPAEAVQQIFGTKMKKRKAELAFSQNFTSQSVVEDEPELDSEGEPVRRSQNGRKLKKKKPRKERMYVIPDVKKRDFRQEFRQGSADSYSTHEARKGGFIGRLGYACLNTVLRSADPPVFSSRTARIKTIEEKGLEWVKELARQNARDIVPMLQWNAANNIRFMRLSSEIFPFASHAKYGYSPDCAKEELEEAGKVARSLQHRVTLHPGQFVQLGSPNEAVVEASIRELEVHTAVLDLMGMNQDSVMIIHGGGVYQDRSATLQRMKATIRDRLPPNVRDRIVLENDEVSWSAEELLPVCREFGIPMVFDFHHDMLRPSKATPQELMPELLQLFRKRGIRPKFHLSHPRPGSRNLRERRAHSDRCGTLPLDLPADADLMIEAKDKEQAVLELYRIYDLYPVDPSVLRPPADDIMTSNGGCRKVLDGSGGASRVAEEADESEGEALQRKSQEKEINRIKRAVEHSKKIAARRGVEYTGPEYIDKAKARRCAGLMLGTSETMAIMEAEAHEIRQELKRKTGRALSEIRRDVEKRFEAIDDERVGSVALRDAA